MITAAGFEFASFECGKCSCDVEARGVWQMAALLMRFASVVKRFPEVRQEQKLQKHTETYLDLCGTI